MLGIHKSLVDIAQQVRIAEAAFKIGGSEKQLLKPSEKSSNRIVSRLEMQMNIIYQRKLAQCHKFTKSPNTFSAEEEEEEKNCV